MAERRAQQIHRDQLRRFSPQLIGAVGLPDPLSYVIAEQRASSQDAGESAKQATPNEFRSRRDDHTSAGSTSHAVGQAQPDEQRPGRKVDGFVDAQSLSQSERDVSQSDEREDPASKSTNVYDQWIARIHPVSEVVDRERVSARKRLNILVLALESVSSVSFDTVLPKSRQLLVDKPNTALFTGYNVIGDAAPANIIPLLTGS